MKLEPQEESPKSDGRGSPKGAKPAGSKGDKSPPGDSERPDQLLSQGDISYVEGSQHIVIELCCSRDSDMKQACKKVGAFYIGVHARMQCTDVCQAVLKLLRVASSGMTFKGKKEDCSVHVHVSLPCTGGSPLLNFCTTQVREQHTTDFTELLGCLDEYFDAFRKCDSNVTTTFELPHNNRYWHLCEIKEFRNRFGLELQELFHVVRLDFVR